MRHITGDDIDHHIVDAVAGVERKIVAAVEAEYLCGQPGGALVGIIEAVRGGKPVQQGRRLAVDWQVIAMIGASDGAEDAVEIAYARQPSESFERLLMRLQNVPERDAIVRFTDWPTAAGRPCSCGSRS